MNQKLTIYGHENILSTHPTTIEFTKEKTLTKRGNCIVGVNTDRALNDFSDKFKKSARNKKTKIIIEIKVGNLKEKITGFGHPDLNLSHKKDIIIRKSDFIDDRTLCIKADKSSLDLNREFVDKLKNPNENGNVIIKLIEGV